MQIRKNDDLLGLASIRVIGPSSGEMLGVMTLEDVFAAGSLVTSVRQCAVTRTVASQLAHPRHHSEPNYAATDGDPRATALGTACLTTNDIITFRSSISATSALVTPSLCSIFANASILSTRRFLVNASAHICTAAIKHLNANLVASRPTHLER